PAVDTLLQTPRTPGLGELLARRVELEKAIRSVPGSRLKVLPCGTPPARDPADVLASSALRALLGRLRGLYDRIVIDTPPAGVIADALALAPLAEGALVVARCGKVTMGELLHLLERLVQARAR